MLHCTMQYTLPLYNAQITNCVDGKSCFVYSLKSELAMFLLKVMFIVTDSEILVS